MTLGTSNSQGLGDPLRTAELLRDANRRLDFHARNSPLAVIEWDASYRVIRWSEEAERMFGWSAEEVLGRELPTLGLVYPDDMPLVFDAMRAMSAGERPRNVNRNRNVRRDGRVISCEWYNSALVDDDGRLVSVYSQVLDVTDREETLARERAARERMTRVQAVTATLARARTRDEIASTLMREAIHGMHFAAGIVGVLTPDGRAMVLLAPHNIPRPLLLDPSPLPLDTPYPLVEAARTGVTVLVHDGDELRARYPEVASRLNGQTPGAVAALPLVVEGTVIGSFVVRSEQARRWSREDLDFLNAIGVQCAQAIDRVRLREAELSRRDEAAATQRFLAHASRVLVEPLDARESLDRLAKLIVPATADACDAYLVDDEGIPRRVSSVDVDPDLAAELARLREERPVAEIPAHPLHRVIASGTTYFRREVPDEEFLRAAGGPDHLSRLRRSGWRSVMLLPLIGRGRTLGAIAVGRRAQREPFTERDLGLVESLAARAALAVDNAQLYGAAERARRDAEEANRAKSDFLAMMSHELRTPLNAIAGYLDLLRMELRGPLTPEQAGDLERIDLAQRRLLALINDVLNFAKLEAGRVEFHLRAVPVPEMLDAVEPLVAPQLESRGLSFARVERPSREALVATADPEKAQQVLLNLLSNAVKFTPPGGRISLLADRRESRIDIHVSDTGIGIAPERVDDIFEPFVQVDTSLTRTADGTGLGLAISRALAREMGGELSVRSVVGEGSTFTFSLPVG